MEINDLQTCEAIVASTAHYNLAGYKITYCEDDLDHHHSYLKTIGLGQYKVGEIVHDFEEAYSKYWEDRKPFDPYTKKYVAKFQKEYQPRKVKT